MGRMEAVPACRQVVLDAHLYSPKLGATHG